MFTHTTFGMEKGGMGALAGLLISLRLNRFNAVF